MHAKTLTMMHMSVLRVPGQPARPLTEVIAEEVRALMGRYNVTQVQLADVLHVSQTGVSKRLRGLIPFDANEMGVLAAYFDVPPEALLGVRSSPRPGPGGGSHQVVTEGYAVTLAAAA